MILAPENNIDAISPPEETRESRNSNDQEIPLNDGDPAGDFPGRLRELAEDYIREVDAATGNNKTQAAKILGIHPTSHCFAVENNDRPEWMRTKGEKGSINHNAHEETRRSDGRLFFVLPHAFAAVVSSQRGAGNSPATVQTHSASDYPPLCRRYEASLHE